MASLSPVVYHKILIVNHQGKVAKFKIRENASTEGIEEAFRARFVLPEDQRFVLVDEDGFDVIVNHTLESGSYKLTLSSDTLAQPSTEQKVEVSASISSTTHTPPPKLLFEAGPPKPEPKVETPAPKSEPKIEPKPEPSTVVDPKKPAEAKTEVKKSEPAKTKSSGVLPPGEMFRRNKDGKVEIVIFDVNVIGETVDAVDEVVSYTILEDTPHKIDVQLCYGNHSFADVVEIYLQGWPIARPIEVIHWIPFDPDKASEVLGAKPGVEISAVNSITKKITFPKIITALFSEGEGSLVIQDRH